MRNAQRGVKHERKRNQGRACGSAGGAGILRHAAHRPGDHPCRGDGAGLHHRHGQGVAGRRAEQPRRHRRHPEKGRLSGDRRGGLRAGLAGAVWCGSDGTGLAAGFPDRVYCGDLAGD